MGTGWPRLWGHKDRTAEWSGLGHELVADDKKIQGGSFLKKLPGIPEAPQEVERKTSSHPSHPSHCLQGKLSCFFLRHGYTNTLTSGSWLSFFLEDNLFSPADKDHLSRLSQTTERDHWKLRGLGAPWERGLSVAQQGSQVLGPGKDPLPPR